MKAFVDYERLGKNINQARKHRGFTQEKLAELTGLSSTHISNVETGKTKVSLDSLVAISDCLNCSIDYLLEQSVTNSFFAEEKHYLNLLTDCTPEEKRLILDVSQKIKESYDKNIKHLL